MQVNSARREGDKVLLEVEPAKGGEKETMEVDVVLVSAGGRSGVSFIALRRFPSPEVLSLWVFPHC
jgi:hypothetical protein